MRDFLKAKRILARPLEWRKEIAARRDFSDRSTSLASVCHLTIGSRTSENVDLKGDEDRGQGDSRICSRATGSQLIFDGITAVLSRDCQ